MTSGVFVFSWTPLHHNSACMASQGSMSLVGYQQIGLGSGASFGVSAKQFLQQPASSSLLTEDSNSCSHAFAWTQDGGFPEEDRRLR